MLPQNGSMKSKEVVVIELSVAGMSYGLPLNCFTQYCAKVLVMQESRSGSWGRAAQSVALNAMQEFLQTTTCIMAKRMPACA